MTPLPPLQRTLRMQAPVAGDLLDDVVRDTIVDPLLQPLARLASQGKAVQALVKALGGAARVRDRDHGPHRAARLDGPAAGSESVLHGGRD